MFKMADLRQISNASASAAEAGRSYSETLRAQ
jgi:hypothetical protein